MRLEYGAKDNGSNDGGCPAYYAASEPHPDYRGDSTDNGYVIQGITLTGPMAEQLVEVADGESAVWVPMNVVLQAADQIREQQLEAA